MAILDGNLTIKRVHPVEERGWAVQLLRDELEVRVLPIIGWAEYASVINSDGVGTLVMDYCLGPIVAETGDDHLGFLLQHFNWRGDLDEMVESWIGEHGFDFHDGDEHVTVTSWSFGLRVGSTCEGPYCTINETPEGPVVMFDADRDEVVVDVLGIDDDHFPDDHTHE